MSLICGQTVTTRSLRTVEEEVGEAGRGTAVEPSPSWFVVEERLRFLVGTSWTCTWILVTFFCSHSFWIVASVRSFLSLALRFFHRNITCFMVHLLARPHGIDVIGYALPNVVFSVIGHFSTFAELKRPTIEAKLPEHPPAMHRFLPQWNEALLSPWFQLFGVANTDLISLERDWFGFCSIRPKPVSSLLVNGWDHLNTSCLCTHSW